MVSLNTIFTLGVIGAGLLAFTSLGGAGGIGSRIGSSFGGGIRSFNENISSSFNAALQGLNPFGAAAAEPAEEKINLQLSSDPSMYTDPATVGINLQNATDMNTGQPIGTSPQLPDPYDSKTVGGQVDTSPAPQATPIDTTQDTKVESGLVNQGKPSETYLQRITQYVKQPLTVIEPRQAQLNVIARAKSDYGGYGSADKQSRALQSLLATNAEKYGSYFN